MKHTLVCTVGTSLTSNLERTPDYRELLTFYHQGRLNALVAGLLALPPDHRLLGAEINSITSIMKRGLLQRRIRLSLLVSATEDGEKIGRLLTQYYLERKNPYCFEKADWQRLAGLTDENPQSFRSEGLRHLVTAIASIAREQGSEHIIINATGGYKAQISFAGLIGQALEIPVCYLFERFSEVIELPPQPVSLDLSLWLKHAADFYDMAQDQGEENPAPKDPRLDSLVDEIVVDDKKVVGLSAMGQLFHESFRYRFKQQRSLLLPPASNLDPDNKRVQYESNLGPRPPGIEAWFKGILRLPYVTGIYTFYYHADLPRANYFRPSSKGAVSQIEGGFSDGTATSKFNVLITANNKDQRDAAIADLCERFLA